MMTHMQSQREVLRSHGLTVPQFIVLIWVRREGPTTLSSLAQVLEVAPQSITSIVDALESAGWIARATVPTDRRASRVALTPTGTKLLGTIRATQRERLERGLDGKTPDTLRAATQVIDAVRTALEPSLRPRSSAP